MECRLRVRQKSNTNLTEQLCNFQHSGVIQAYSQITQSTKLSIDHLTEPYQTVTSSFTLAPSFGFSSQDRRCLPIVAKFVESSIFLPVFQSKLSGCLRFLIIQIPSASKSSPYYFRFFVFVSLSRISCRIFSAILSMCSSNSILRLPGSSYVPSALVSLFFFLFSYLVDTSEVIYQNCPVPVIFASLRS